MNDYHDPFRYVSYLEQALSQDKKPLGLLLGAGCPVSIKDANSVSLIPDIAGMTTIVCDRLAKSEPLQRAREHFEKDERAEPNIEELLTHVRTLKVVAGKETVRGLKQTELEQLDLEICNVIHDLANRTLPSRDTPYNRLAAWVDAIPRTLPVEVFTTNYDLLMEEAFEDSQVPYFDGFSGSRKAFFDLHAMEEDRLPARWARLWKLHGSISWFQDSLYNIYRGRDEKGASRLIHPSHLKYDESRRMPYLAMIDRLRAFLKQSSAVLVVSGYSFRDDHINEVLVQGLQANTTAAAFALMFGSLTQYPKAISLAQERPNLTLLSADQAVSGGRRGTWTRRPSEGVDMSTSRWIRWVDVNPVIEETKEKRAELSLGDFKILGDFLHHLIGSMNSVLP